MKKILFLFSFLSIYNLLTAQQSVDSMQKILNAHPQEDTLKVKQLNDLARICFSVQQYEKGFTAINHASELSKKLQYAKGDGLRLLTMSVLHASSELFQYYYLQSSWLYLEKSETEKAFAFVIAEREKGLLEKENSRRLQAADFFEKQQDNEAAIHLLIMLSSFYIYNHKANEALIYADRALKLNDQPKEKIFSVALLLLKFFALHQQGKTKESKEAEQAVVKIIAEASDPVNSAFFTFQLCSYYYAMGNKAVAMEKELKLENTLEQLGEKQMRIIITEDLAVYFAYLNMAQKSIDYYKKSIALREQLHYFHDAIRIYFNLGFELVGTKQFEEAKKYFAKARKLSQQQDNKDLKLGSELRYADAMGQILMGQQKYTEALEVFNKGADNGYVNYYKAYCYQ